jgi:mannosyltransferase OCH1-like enzyme
MIPKKIHYCWFGRNPKPKLAQKCIKSWKKYCKGYEIIEWNEDNFDISSAPLYVRQAYDAKKWAFVTDYVRLWAMTKYGGIYMDTDVEVIKPLDQFLKHRAFSGFEDHIHIPTGIMACEKDFPLFREFLDFYDTVSFMNPDGTYNQTTNVQIITDVCLKRGLIQNNTLQEIDGFTLYPNDVFCPVNYYDSRLYKTRNTATIHWFSGSWQDSAIHASRRKTAAQLRRKNTIHIITHLPNRCAIKLLGQDRYNKLKKKLKH